MINVLFPNLAPIVVNKDHKQKQVVKWKDVFSSHISSPSPLREVKARSQGKNPESRTEAKSRRSNSYLFAPMKYYFVFFFPIWESTTHSELIPFTSVLNQENATQAFLQVIWWRHFLNWDFSSQICVSLCQIDKKQPTHLPQSFAL